ncbi:hypothetical protein ILUMI_27381 [Ignelater luminosus]|uniref:BAG domain-containing protein n=1 Tax=Ignelater luminosus TaxID=2038154 RepID=A0A8K0C6M6_IGNLU|nr:hypothetical protein ILUMI_27381 [Ignelater luminosus]
MLTVLVRIIRFPLKLLLLYCRFIISLPYYFYNMLCGTPDSDEVREWKHQIDHRKSLDKQLKNVGKRFLNERRSGRVSVDAQNRLEHVLKSADASYNYLMEYVRPLLTNNVMLNIFSYERVKKENESLKVEIAKLKTEKQAQKQRFEQTIKSNHQTFLDEQKHFHKKNSELKSYCEFLEKEKDDLKNVKTTHNRHTDPLIAQNIDVNKFKELSYKTKEQRFEETLKTQNILIEDLKLRLENSEKQIENLKLLNRDLAKRNSQQTINENKHDNIQFENEKQKTQECKQQLLDSQQKYEDLQRLRDKQEMELNHRTQQLQKISQEKATLQYNILKYETQIKDCYKEIESLKLQIQDLEQQIKQQHSIIEHQNNEIKTLNKKQTEENLHPIPAPRKSEVGLTQDKGEVYSKKEEHDPTEDTNENENEEEIPYIRECLQKIEDINEDTLKLEKEVDKFSGTTEDKDFYHFQELLIRNIVKLDNVETEGYFIIREKRRMAIRLVQKVIDALKEKAT